MRDKRIEKVSRNIEFFRQELEKRKVKRRAADQKLSRSPSVRGTRPAVTQSSKIDYRNINPSKGMIWPNYTARASAIRPGEPSPGSIKFGDLPYSAAQTSYVARGLPVQYTMSNPPRFSEHYGPGYVLGSWIQPINSAPPTFPRMF